MTKIKHIYVTGDSFSFGQELGGSDPDDFFLISDHMKTHAYPGIIAREWGLNNYTNTSYPGGSNDRIQRQIMYDIPKLLTEYKSDEIFVIISMTHCARREFYDRELGRWETLICNYPPSIKHASSYCLWKYYSAYYNSSFESVRRFIMQIISIQLFLKSLNVDYIMTNSMGDDDVDSEYKNIDDNIKSIIDRRHYPEIDAFNQYAGILKLPFGKYRHPLEEGHVAWAAYLLKYMKIKKIGYYDDTAIDI